MVNSGSSANLLACAALCNPARSNRLKAGDEVLLPAVCWSTSVWPLLQFQLVPVFVDVDENTLNMNMEDARRKITPRTRAVLLVHVLGMSAPMVDVMELVQQHNLLLFEDTCESLGSTYQCRALGTFGQFGQYSFYYSVSCSTLTLSILRYI